VQDVVPAAQHAAGLLGLDDTGLLVDTNDVDGVPVERQHVEQHQHAVAHLALDDG
jgi:hypothetical protein